MVRPNDERLYDKDFFVSHSSASLSSAQAVVPTLIDLVKPKSVVDVGCGTADWLSVFVEHKIDDVVGVDGSYVEKSLLRIPVEHFHECDLGSEEFITTRTFDLAISLEVAEHLPLNRAEAFVRSLTKLSSTVLFSAAIPFQGGTGHINEQWPDYWAGIFDRYDFQPLDILRERFWNDSRVAAHYRQNMLIFVDKHTPTPLTQNGEPISAMEFVNLLRVHPAIWMERADPSKIGLRNLLRFAPQQFYRFVRSACRLAR